MAITLETNYRQILSEETLTVVDELMGDNFYLGDMLEFIDNYSEEDFVKYYEGYVLMGEEIGYEIVDAYLTSFDMEDVENVREKYFGSYDSEAEFAEQYVTDSYGDIPAIIVVDWQKTWDNSLSDDFEFVNGYVFRNY